MDWLDYSLYGMIVILIALLVGIVINERKYNFYVRVRELTGTKTLVKDVKGKIIKKKGQPETLFIKKFKDHLQVPPFDAIDITAKGKKVVEVYKIGEKQYRYLIDDNKNFNVKQPVFDDETGETSYELEDNVKELKFRIFNSDDKEFLVNQYRIALERRGFKWQEHIPMITSGIVLVTVFVVALAFYPEIIEKAGLLIDKLSVVADKIDSSLKVVSSCQQVPTQGVAPN